MTHRNDRYDRGFCKHGQTCKNRHRRKVVCVRYVSGFCPLGPDCELAHLPWEMTLLGKDEEGNEIAIKKLPTHDGAEQDFSGPSRR